MLDIDVFYFSPGILAFLSSSRCHEKMSVLPVLTVRDTRGKQEKT